MVMLLYNEMTEYIYAILSLQSILTVNVFESWIFCCLQEDGGFHFFLFSLLYKVSCSHVDVVGLPYTAAVSVTVNSDGQDTTITGAVVGVDVPVLVKYNSLVFSGAVSLSGNLSFARGNPGKVLAEIVPKFGDNGVINNVHVSGDGAESIVVICTSSPISASCPCVSL